MKVRWFHDEVTGHIAHAVLCDGAVAIGTRALCSHRGPRGWRLSQPSMPRCTKCQRKVKDGGHEDVSERRKKR